MEILIDRSSQIPIYRQIVARIEEMILGGRLPEGFKLPPERRLAASLEVNRSTVLAAYRELKGLGLIDSHVGRGTLVRAMRPGADHQPSAGDAPGRTQISWRQILGDYQPRIPDPLIRDLLSLAERPDVISLAAGLPASELMPLETIRGLLDTLLTRVGPAVLQHSPTEGLTRLREAISRWLVSRGIPCRSDEVLVLSGSQQGLDLIASELIRAGDEVVVEEPSYIGALPVLTASGARLISVPVDGEGMRTDMLAAILDRRRPRLIYTLPTFQNPSGAVMSLERRQHLLELAARHQVPVLEDDPYSELRYGGARVPSLRALDSTGVVLYLGTFSKIICPGLRIGYMVAPRPVLQQLVLAKQASDLHTNTLGQHLVERFITEGHLEPHLIGLRAAYSAKRDAMARALATAADVLRWQAPEGGFYFWCRMTRRIELSRLLGHAADAGVAFLPGASCFAAEPAESYVRLSFSFPTETQIAEGVGRFVEAVRCTAEDPRALYPEAAGTPPLV